VSARRRVRAKFWYRAYRSRMNEGYEPCRNRGCSRLARTFGRIVPAARGGKYVSSNLTLLCRKCNTAQDDQIWAWLQPLTAEPDFLEIAYGGSSAYCQIDIPRGSATATVDRHE